MWKSHTMSFDGSVLERGFWLYIWDIRGPTGSYVYVGRTGDSSSPNAQSPFKRISQHLDPNPKAKGNALGRQLQCADVDPLHCKIEMTAIGPIFEEQTTMDSHRPVRDKMAALERALADMLRERGYHVLGKHPRAGHPDPNLLKQLACIVDERFPAAILA